MTRRDAYTLIELVVASASASVLMVGLSSALYVSTQGLDSRDGAIAGRNDADAALGRVLDDLAEARGFEVLLPGEAKFRVPDRDADGAEETLHYGWSGTSGDPLWRSVNGGARAVLLPDVRALSFTALSRAVPAQDVTVNPNPLWPVLESQSVSKPATRVTSLAIAAPLGLLEGELLIAAVAIDKNRLDTLAPPAGWTELDKNEESGQVTFGVWWKLAGAAEPAVYNWVWSNQEEAIGLVLRISNQYPGVPITSYATNGGADIEPLAPATGVTLEHSMVVRLGGFDSNQVTVGDPGVAGHVAVLMDQSGDGVSLGCAYKNQNAPGDSGDARFTLVAGEEFRTLTVVIAPEAQP